ncbi:serine--tRNA ligase, mitochondrial-like [Tubulanus polymorphus]|uniref:serine--tRNA ligase, mitochondrial-like n=1 Tax=Tubulanus polymorphus TaxID=672921 RepID=UPI003DA3952F
MLSFNRFHFLVVSRMNLVGKTSVKNFRSRICLRKESSPASPLAAPELNWQFLLDEKNADLIDENIRRRKGVGDIRSVRKLAERLKLCAADEKTTLQKRLIEEATSIPNLSHPDSPIGDESNARTVFVDGEKKRFDFCAKSVVELGERLGVLRTNDVNLTTGNKSYYFVDELAKLEHALVQFALDKLVDSGFEVVSVPDLLSADIVEASGFRTSGDVAQVYRLNPQKHAAAAALCLSGTAELAIGGMNAGRTFDFGDLPRRMATVSRCYRAETSDLQRERGIYRVHEFTKVEMYGITAADNDEESGRESEEVLEEFVNLQRSIFSDLDLHYRVLDMPTQELGAPAFRKFDIETWMPAKQFYGEISSASNCTDFQSRRLGIKYRTPGGALRHVHTVNGTACAVPRLIMALIENNQTEDGSITIPEMLQPYTKFDTIDETSSRSTLKFSATER